MQAVLSSVTELSGSPLWLVTANFILSVLLALWMLRYRRLYFRARSQQSNTDELIENLSEGIYRSLPSGRQIKANRALVRLNGYQTEREMLAKVSDIAGEWYVDPNRRNEFMRLIEQDGKVVDFISEIYRHKTRERIWITESARLVRHKRSGRPLYYEGSVREITETVKRLKLEEQFSKLMREVPGSLFQCTVTPGKLSVVDYLSPGFERLSGIPAQAQMADWRAFLSRVPDADRALYAECFGLRGGYPQPFDIEHRYTCPLGEEKWIRVSATPEIAEGAVIWHGYLSDVTLRKNNQLAVERLAYYDTLTGLPNRRAFLDRIAGAVRACAADHQRGALLFIDLDNFKSLNDTQGHDVGDKYLIKAAERLQATAGAGRHVARIGGDEFVVLIEDAGPTEAEATRSAITLGNRLVTAMRQPFELGEVNHRASASIGVVVFDGSSAEPDEVLKRADVAMYEAKSSGRDSVALYDPVSMNREAERYKLLADLKDAISQGGIDFELHYQPLVDEAGGVVAAEALIRWHHPELGLIAPDRFIPLAEQFGLISGIGAIVVERAVATLARWQRHRRLMHLRLSINLSVQCFQQEELVPTLRRLLAEYGVSGTRLTIEVTEHVMARDQALIAERMLGLKSLGVGLALDDFGTGYSSLTYLKTLPFDEVKVDGSFVADIDKSESNRVLVQTILGMARTLGLTSVAERVETAEQEAFLRAHGCNRFQGWLYARAQPLAAFETYAHEHASDVAEAFTLALASA